MKEPQLKRIEYDKFTVDFVERDSNTYLHFYKTDAKNESFFDKAVAKSFRFPIKETGKEIEEELLNFAPEVNYLKYDKRTLLESRDRDGKFKNLSERELEVHRKHEELQSKYEDKSVIHKSITYNFLSAKLQEKVYSYIVPEINPFIDEVILDMTENLEELLKKSN